MKSKVDFKWKSNEGCIFKIVGVIEYSVGFSGLSVNGFEGTVEVSGGGSCGNGTYTFGVINPKEDPKNQKDLFLGIKFNNTKDRLKFVFESNTKEVPNNLTSEDFLNYFNKELSFLNIFNNSECKKSKIINVYIN